ncbi:hypothetical protein [Methylobacterium planeticum]|uniref:Uncharacterized protein n=1 Tax=Methylobacterium planeticum TaxID=2615211 RepID=A0A6N6MNN1_9HYPH|nr:hypothetical protein [Methylobacterium planeticum]KAB1072478.1 hypothetical protein F6X51_15955 [Methylobacterium planeticum]
MERSQQRGLARLLLRHPERRQELRRKFAENAQLRELCEAYEAACEAAEYWAKSSDPVGPARTEEYRELATATEEDIFHAIS